MNAKVTPKGDSHWYDKLGNPQYTVIAKGTGLPRKSNLTDARKAGWVPSVTGIISGADAKPGLVAWLQDQAIDAALTLPRIPGESLEDFKRRVMVDMEAHSEQAMELGNRIHTFAEDYVHGNAPVLIPGVEESLRQLQTWVDCTVGNRYVRTERSLASVAGFGGRCDIYGILKSGEYFAGDWKSQNVKPGNKPIFYDSFAMQLAAYSKAITENAVAGDDVPWIDRRFSVVIGTNPLNQGVWVKEWEEQVRDYAAFLNCLELWIYRNNYDPRSAL